MKITQVEAVPLWGGSRNFLYVVVETDTGLSGVGEAGLAGRELAVMGAVEHFRERIAGLDPFRTEHIAQVLHRCAFFPAQRVETAAIAAIDTALWDIKGKALGVPVYELLGGRVRDRVVCYPHNRGHPTEVSALVESCLETKAAGWRFVRWGLPDGRDGVIDPRASVRLALRQLAAVREAVGEEIEICLDVHTRLDLPEAVWLCREAEPFHPYFVEDPLRCEHAEAYRSLRGRTGVPLAAGEQCGTKWEFRPLIEEEWIDYARIDLGLCGGFTEARKIAGWCETHGIRLATHNPLGPVSSAACLHLNLATPNFGVQEQPRKPAEFLPDVFAGAPVWEDGHLLPSDRPGLGVEFDRAAARRHPYRTNRIPELRRDDGSFTNW